MVVKPINKVCKVIICTVMRDFDIFMVTWFNCIRIITWALLNLWTDTSDLLITSKIAKFVAA